MAWRRWTVLVLLVGCRVERVPPGGRSGASCSDDPHGTLWVYNAMHPKVVTALEPVLAKRLPKVRIQWFSGGSEKVASRLDAELGSGGTVADVVALSDPFPFVRLKEEGRLFAYASPYAVRIPESLVDPDGLFFSTRLSTMVIAHRPEVRDPPRSYRELAEARWKGEVVLGDPLVSGTNFTWAVFLEKSDGVDYFRQLRQNGATVAGGNAAVQQRLESGQAKVGVLALENILWAREQGSTLTFTYPEDLAVTVPGVIAILRSTKNPTAAKAFVDAVLSPEGQAVMVAPGNLHAVDPRLRGPGAEPDVRAHLAKTRPWGEAMFEHGARRGPQVKQAFRELFEAPLQPR